MSLYHILLLPIYLWLASLLWAIISVVFVAVLSAIAHLFSSTASDEESGKRWLPRHAFYFLPFLALFLSVHNFVKSDYARISPYYLFITTSGAKQCSSS